MKFEIQGLEIRGLRIEVDETAGEIVVVLAVPDRTTREPREVFTRVRYTPDLNRTYLKVRYHLRLALEQALAHEIDEWLTVNGFGVVVHPEVPA